MDSHKFREAAKASIDEITTYLDNIAEREVVSKVEPGYLRKLLPEEAPENGEDWSDIQKDLETKILPGITHWQHPGFHAFFPCAVSYPSMLGELYSSALSGACFNWINSPAATELETIVLDWLAKMLGLPQCFLSTGPTHGGGVIQGSASEAVLTAMVAAREKHLRETVPADLKGQAREDAEWAKRSRMVALASSATHSSARKAAQILGLRFLAITTLAEDGYALTRTGLEKALDECAARGLEPFFLVATLGTTDTCAVDDFRGIDEAVQAWTRAPISPVDGSTGRGHVWVHVDAAYAGAALVCPEVQEATRIGLVARFHSFNTNMHKWLLTNFDASCLFVRDREWFVRALTVNQAVYVNAHSDGGLVTDYREWQIPLGRRFRALKIWFVLRTYGVVGLQAHIRRTMHMSQDFAGWLRARPDLFDVLAGPSFALTVFRLRDKDDANDRLADRNLATKTLYDKVNASGKVWVTSTLLDDMFAIRMQTGGDRTRPENVKEAYLVFERYAEEILKETPEHNAGDSAASAVPAGPILVDGNQEDEQS